jgi:hypothetical protein
MRSGERVDAKEASMTISQALNTAAARLKQAAHAVARSLSEAPPARGADAGDLPEEDTVFQEDAARARAKAASGKSTEDRENDLPA